MKNDEMVGTEVGEATLVEAGEVEEVLGAVEVVLVGVVVEEEEEGEGEGEEEDRGESTKHCC